MKKRRVAALLAVSLMLGLVNTRPVFGAEDLLVQEQETDMPGRDTVFSEDTVGNEDAPDSVVAEDTLDTVNSADIGMDTVLDAVAPESDIISENEINAEEAESIIAGDIKKVNDILSQKDVLAIIYLSDTYPLRSKPSDDSDVVTTLECGTTVLLKEAVYDRGIFRFLVSVCDDTGDITGYLPMDSFVCVDEDFLAWQEGLGANSFTGDVRPYNASQTTGITGKALESVYTFPDSYRDKLIKVLKAHPNWVFVPQKVGTTLNKAIDEEMSDRDRNLVYKTAQAAYKDGAYDSNWYRATKACLLYYMNPANFVDSEQNIFMFEQLTYNASYHTEEGVQKVLSQTFMSGQIPGEGMTYAHAFYQIGSSLKVSPYHLAARVSQEQGKGTSKLISGDYPGYEGYYNYFNVKASGKTTADIYKNGLTYAKNQGWNTRYKSLLGGAGFTSRNYILAGQDTPYLEKYNVVKKVYYHQYMQNVSAPQSEASKVYSMYKNSGALNNPFVFKIPVYDGDTISPAPPVKPTYKVTNVKQSNLYYTMGTDEACAVVNITASEGIKSIALNAESKEALEAKETPYFDVASYNKNTGDITLTPRLMTPSNYNKINRNVVMDITFADYGTMTYKFNVSTINKAPDIKTVAATVYAGIDKGFIGLTHDALPSDITVTCNDDKMILSVKSDLSGIDFASSEGFKGGSKKLTFTSASFRTPITKNVSVKYYANPASVYRLSLSNTINLVNRANTYVQVTPNMNDFKGMTVDSVEITGEEAALFTLAALNKGDLLPNGKPVTAANGVFILKAKDGADLVTNKTYKVNIRSRISNGLIIDKVISTRPGQSAKRTSGNVNTLTLTALEPVGEYTVKTAGVVDGDSEIKEVSLVEDKNSVYFDYTPYGKQDDPHVLSGKITLKDDTLKKGRYRLGFMVTYKGHASNINPAKVYVTIDVK